MESKRDRLDRLRTADRDTRWPWSMACYGLSWESRWCLLDFLFHCKVRWICRRHDAVIFSYDMEAMGYDPDWEAEAAAYGDEALEFAIEATTATEVYRFNSTASTTSTTLEVKRSRPASSGRSGAGPAGSRR